MNASFPWTLKLYIIVGLSLLFIQEQGKNFLLRILLNCYSVAVLPRQTGSTLFLDKFLDSVARPVINRINLGY